MGHFQSKFIAQYMSFVVLVIVAFEFTSFQLDIFKINEVFVLCQAAIRNVLLILMTCTDESNADLLFSVFLFFFRRRFLM